MSYIYLTPKDKYDWWKYKDSDKQWYYDYNQEEYNKIETIFTDVKKHDPVITVGELKYVIKYTGQRMKMN